MAQDDAAAQKEDALIDDVLEEALSVYRGVVAPEVLEIIKAQLGDALAATRDGRALVRAMTPDPHVNKSDDVQAPVAQSPADPNAQRSPDVAGSNKKAGGDT